MFDLTSSEGRTKAIRFVSLNMAILGIAYTGTIIVFTFFNDQFFWLLHWLWGVLDLSTEPTPEHTFYKALALGNMFMLVAMSYWTWKDPVGKRILFPVVFVSKLSSSLMGTAFFFFQNGYWSNLVIPFTDLSQVFMAWYFYKWMNQVAAATDGD